MTIDRIVMGFAGSVVLASIVLAHFVSPQWLWLTAFMGANLLQASFSGFCPLATILKHFGVQPGHAFS